MCVKWLRPCDVQNVVNSRNSMIHYITVTCPSLYLLAMSNAFTEPERMMLSKLNNLSSLPRRFLFSSLPGRRQSSCRVHRNGTGHNMVRECDTVNCRFSASMTSTVLQIQARCMNSTTGGGGTIKAISLASPLRLAE